MLPNVPNGAKRVMKMNGHRFVLQVYRGMNTRFLCPNCGSKNKTFVRYIDTTTGLHLSPSVGRCNRETNCGYHYTPKQFFNDNQFQNGYQATDRHEYETMKPLLKIAPKSASFIPNKQFRASLQKHDVNNFVGFLINLLGHELASKLIGQYFIGTSKHWSGAAVFWQIDIKGKVRTGKIMLYNPTTGKRIRKPFDHITWVHSLLKQPEFELQQCLFGEHLLEDKTKPVAIVESEKTAVIASVYLPEFIWLAAGSLNSLNVGICSVLKGRSVSLFPDLNGFANWNNKKKELSRLGTFTISDLLERKATEEERKENLDLADYLIRFDHREFSLSKHDLILKPLPNIKQFQVSYPVRQEQVKFQSWEHQISELETFFQTITIPTSPVVLDQCALIKDVSKFLVGHLATVKAHSGNQAFLPYLYRLQKLKYCLAGKINNVNDKI